MTATVTTAKASWLRTPMPAARIGLVRALVAA